jgi:hypothetical protein
MTIIVYDNNRNISQKGSYTYKNGVRVKYTKEQRYSNGKQKYYEQVTSKAVKKIVNGKTQYQALPVKKQIVNYQTTGNGQMMKQEVYDYNKNGQLKKLKGSNAKYTSYTYKNNKVVKKQTNRYNAKGKMVPYYVVYYNLSNNNQYTKKLERYYNKSGNLKSGAIQYITSYRNGKAYQTTRYYYNDNGKLFNKKAVSVRK